VSLYKDKLLGLPIVLSTTVLFSNKELLDKYHKPIPKTWDELIETGKEILEKERLLYNNSDIIGYNGFLQYYEHGICSVYEFIYSCRESYESPFPELKSQTTINALKQLKKIKNEISSDEIFKENLEFTEDILNNGNALFFKYYTSVLPYMAKDTPYVVSLMPGLKEGISGSIMVGYNVGIDGSIKKEREESAIEFIRIMTTKEMQKYFVLYI